jgi:tetratricopeptide (TPR) repeat protein
VPPLADIEAVELFSERARLKPDEVIAELCRRLDDLPLAVELAAARASVLTPAQILERLSTRLDLLKGGRDAEARQATLRATIEWSYELLSPAEQSLFARLSTFRGGFTLEAAETIADADLDVLGALVDKSLLRRNDERFAMLETIREFAAERLEASGEADELPHRHADFFLGLAERAYAQRMASDTDWLAILDAEHDNIRAALDWTAGHDPRTHAGLAGACAFYWDSRGFASEALERLLGAASRYLVRDRIRARALTFLSIVGFRAHMAEAAGEAADAGQRIEQAIELWRALGDPRGEAMALEQRGLMRVAAGDVDAARRDLERSLALLREAGASELEQAVSLSGLCQLLVSIGDVTSAEPLARELEDLAHRAGSAELLSDALHYLADVPLLAGDFWEAQERYRRAVAHARAHGMRIQCTNDLLGLAMALAGQGQDARAVRLASAAYEQRVRLGIRRLSPMRFWRELQERHIGAARARLSSDQLEAAEREGGGADFETILDEVSAPETADDQA